MIRHRFIVVGAFQTLNATEARHHLGLDDAECELVFLLPPQARAAAETFRMIEATEWTHVRVIGPANTSVVHWMRKVRNGRGLLGEGSDLEHLVIGDYQTQLARHAAHGVRDGEVITLDDGFATLLIHRYRQALADGRRPPRLHAHVRRSQYEVQRVMARLLGLRLGDLGALTFFTIYAIAPPAPDRLVTNRYEWLRSRFPEPEIVPGTLFLGSPFVESGIVDHDVYAAMLGSVRDQADGPLWYRPHPRERSDHVAALTRELGVELLDLDTIVEYGLLAGGWTPATIASNHSTTLDTLRVVLGDRVSVRALPLAVDDVAPRWRDWVRTTTAELDTRLGEPVERFGA